MKLNNVNNVSFKSARLIKGPASQLQYIESLVQKKSIRTINKAFITKSGVKRFPDSEFVKNDVIKDEFAAFEKTGEYSSKELSIGFPIKNFDFDVTKIKEGGNGTDSVYLFTTKEKAAEIGECKNKVDMVKSQIEMYKRTLSETQDRTKHNKLVETLGRFMEDRTTFTQKLKAMIDEYSNMPAVNAENILKAIKEKRFDFSTLSVTGKTFLLNG